MTEEQLAASREQLKRDLTGLQSKEDLAKRELERGTSPAWVSNKYGIDRERCEKYVAALIKQQEMKRERTQSACQAQ